MEFRNLTPFAVMNYKMLDVADNEHHVIVMKVGYSLTHFSEGIYQAILETDAELCFQDEYLGEPFHSSVRFESDLAPFKPYCDLMVIGSAIAPQSTPTESFIVGLNIIAANNQNLLKKELRILGPRYLEYQNDSWLMTEPQKIGTLPIEYEYAFGGENRVCIQDPLIQQIESQYLLSDEQRSAHPAGAEAPIAHSYCETNPLGKGYVRNWYAKATGLTSLAAPQIENVTSPFTLEQFLQQLAEHQSPSEASCFGAQGFGPIARSWMPRLAKAGTYDQQWLDHRHPYLPKDFNFNYWNCAPDDQQIPYPDANLRISVSNMTADGLLEVTLPEHRAFLLARMTNGAISPIQLNIDTIILDTNKLTLSLTFRQIIETALPIKVLEARFETNPSAPLFSVELAEKGEQHGG
nr:DUF2169 domain-containing protein [uncultured Moellerella sp.]